VGYAPGVTAGTRRFGVYAVLIVCAYVGVSGITTVYSLLSTLYRVFDDPTRIGWVVSAYYLVSAVSAAVCGRLGDLLGRRRITLALLPVAGTGALISATAGTLDGVIAGCAIQGVAGALTPLAMGIARETLPMTKVPLAVGVITATSVAGGGLSFVVAGIVIDRFSWNGGFYLKAVLAAIGIVMVLTQLPSALRPRNMLPKVNVAAGLLFAPAVAGFFVANQLAQSRGWLHPSVTATLGASAALLIVWAKHQAGEEFPLIDVRLLVTRQIAMANLCFVFLCLGVMQNGQIVSLFLQQPVWTNTGFGMTAAASGAMMVVQLSVAVVAGPLGGTLTTRRGAREVAVYGFFCGAVGWFANAAFHQSLGFFMSMCMLGSVCVSITQTAAYNLVIEATPEDRTSEAVGLSAVMISIFMAIGSQIVTALLATSRFNDTVRGIGTFPADGAYRLLFAYVGLMSVFGLTAAAALRRGVPRSALRIA
jgi:MFS family permease